MTVDRDLGRHDAEIDQLQSDVTSIKGDVADIKETLAQAKGGWRTLMLVAGVASAVTALLTPALAKFLGLLHFK